ncbi:MAG TPA: hypothetical protein ENH03_04165 [Candidatus Bathyarchaeota archaeon]|nr:hypothetical protein [Candidatus Bathyarchaeota archaeon]
MIRSIVWSCWKDPQLRFLIKNNGFGGDYSTPGLIPAHLFLARENIACALSNLVLKSWISESEVISIAADWLYNNPNELFKLGLKPLCSLKLKYSSSTAKISKKDYLMEGGFACQREK